MSIQDSIKNGIISASSVNPVSSNSPVKNRNQNNPWSNDTALLYEQMAPYASDVFNAQIQGLDYADFYSWSNVKIRAASVFDPTTGENLDAGWRRILVIGRKPLQKVLKNNALTIGLRPANKCKKSKKIQSYLLNGNNVSKLNSPMVKPMHLLIHEPISLKYISASIVSSAQPYSVNCKSNLIPNNSQNPTTLISQEPDSSPTSNREAIYYESSLHPRFCGVHPLRHHHQFPKILPRPRMVST